MAMLNNQMVTEKEREREKKDNELDAKWYGTW